jgi:FkbM family methyltransferase
MPATRVIMVEAQEAKQSELEQVASDFRPNADVEIALLGARVGEVVPFTVMSTGSSVFEERNSYAPRQQTQRETQRLDDILERKRCPPPDLLKLDVQG